MLVVTNRIRIPLSEFRWSFVRAGGPGGQNVNKVASKAVIRWDVSATTSLPADVKSRLLEQQANRITTAGELVVASQRFRDQERNREDVLQRLAEMVRRASISPKPRKPTRRTRGSVERRLTAKRHRSQRKSTRRAPDE
jgi:ribosome-associated protein